MAKFLDTSGLTYLWGKITAALGTKQNTLTPGSNITISNDTISATDTNRAFSIYSDTSGGAGPTEIVSSNSKKELRFYAIQSVDNLILTKFTETDDRVVLRITATDTKPTSHSNIGSGTVEATKNAWTNIWSFSLAAGEWIIQIAVGWQSSSSANSDNGTGYRAIELNDGSASAGSGGYINGNVIQAVSGTRTVQQMTCIVRPSTTTTYTIYAKHNYSSNIYAIPRIRYVKIG